MTAPSGGGSVVIGRSFARDDPVEPRFHHPLEAGGGFRNPEGPAGIGILRLKTIKIFQRHQHKARFSVLRDCHRCTRRRVRHGLEVAEKLNRRKLSHAENPGLLRYAEYTNILHMCKSWVQVLSLNQRPDQTAADFPPLPRHPRFPFLSSPLPFLVIPASLSCHPRFPFLSSPRKRGPSTCKC